MAIRFPHVVRIPRFVIQFRIYIMHLLWRAVIHAPLSRYRKKFFPQRAHTQARPLNNATDSTAKMKHFLKQVSMPYAFEPKVGRK